MAKKKLNATGTVPLEPPQAPAPTTQIPSVQTIRNAEAMAQPQVQQTARPLQPNFVSPFAPVPSGMTRATINGQNVDLTPDEVKAFKGEGKSFTDTGIAIAAEQRKSMILAQMAAELEKQHIQEQQQQTDQNIALDQNKNIVNEVGVLNSEQQNRQFLTSEDSNIGKATDTAAALGGAALGARTGAALGSLTLNPVGVAVGATAGALVGATAGLLTEKLRSHSQDATKADTTIKGSIALMDYAIDELNKGHISRSRAEQIFDDNLANIYAVERALKRDTTDSIDSFTSQKSQRSLIKIEQFKTKLPDKINSMKLAMAAPNPNAPAQSEPITADENGGFLGGILG